MIKRALKSTARWQKLAADGHQGVEAFLLMREKLCVQAAARFVRLKEGGGRAWYFSGPGGEISAILIQSHRSLFPVFDTKGSVPDPRFLKRLLGRLQVHSIQGSRQDTEILETLMEAQGCFAADRNDYVLMNLDTTPRPEALRAGPSGLILRPPVLNDIDCLFELQSVYEQEEVLPRNAVFNPAVCRINLEQIIYSERILVAEIGGVIVGKINTNAESFTRFQIGGVYVRPDFRGRGVGAKMTAVFVQDLLAQGKGVSLFVKKRNQAAIKVYHKTGFSALADFRICYY
jgi:predicted GNAT family acetyltransferase